MPTALNSLAAVTVDGTLPLGCRVSIADPPRGENRLLRQRGEFFERPFSHVYETSPGPYDGLLSGRLLVVNHDLGRFRSWFQVTIDSAVQNFHNVFRIRKLRSVTPTGQ
jgi:hypothetical protein